MNFPMIVFRRARAACAALTCVLCLIVLSNASARAVERDLVGIRIFSPVSVILGRFGDPTFITPGTSYATFTYTPGQPTVTAPAESSGAAQNAPSAYGAPTMPMGPMSPIGAPSASGTSGASDEFNILYPSASRYYYNFPTKGLTYEFVVSAAGRVIAIKVIGYKGSVRTAKGITLGNTYAQVIEKYGYPESTTGESDANGTILTLSYLQRDHVVFRIARNIVSVISISAPD